ncbi:MAG: sulfatase-like hydrolase/transferase, partial [Bacteroidales bacterium]|nr:sulfatase-like hydrolase/transferase [Bacteroidales bacterium]
MNRKTSLSLVTILVLVIVTIVILVNNNPRDKSSKQMPNIIFILADDMGYGDLRVLNPESKIPTPNMDQLAKEGMYFTDAHSYSGVCTPTRYGV